MVSHALALYTGSCSTYNLDSIPASIDLVTESSYVKEEARLITKAPLAIMAPPSYSMSGGLSLKTMTRYKAPLRDAKEKKAVPTRATTGAIGLKRKAPEVSGPSKRSVVTPSGNSVSRASSSLPSTSPSPLYTMLGVRKPTKKMVNKPAPPGKEPESSGAPLRFKRMVKPPIRG